MPLLDHCGDTLVPTQNVPMMGILYIDGKGNSATSVCKVKIKPFNDNQKIHFRVMVRDVLLLCQSKGKDIL